MSVEVAGGWGPGVTPQLQSRERGVLDHPGAFALTSICSVRTAVTALMK